MFSSLSLQVTVHHTQTHTSKPREQQPDIHTDTYMSVVELWNITATCVVTLVLAVWHSGSALVLISEVNLPRDRLVLGQVTLSGFSSQCGTFICICNQPSR